MVSLYKPITFEKLDEIKLVVGKQIVFHPNVLKISYYVNKKRRNPENLGLKQCPLTIT